MELKSPLPGLVTWQMVALLGLSTWLLWRRRRAVELVLEDAELFAAQKDLTWPLHYQQLLGSKALLMVNELHVPIRALHAKAFGDRQLESYLQPLQKLTAKHLQTWAQQGDMELHAEFKKYIYRCSFAVLLGADERNEELAELFESTMKGLDCRVPLDLPWLPFRRCLKARETLTKKLLEIIEQRRKKLRDPCRMFRICTMLDALLQAGEDADEELIDFCVGVVYAGHGKMVSSVESCLQWLKRLPHVEALLRAEIACWDGQVNRRALALPQLRAFLEEVWRTTPPTPFLVRKLGKDAELHGHRVPQGTTLHFPLAQQSSFSLERHLSDGKFQERVEPVNAFGTTSRRCIGSNLARDQLLIFLLHFLDGFELHIDPREMKSPRLQGVFSKRRDLVACTA